MTYDCGDIEIDDLTKQIYPKLKNKVVIVQEYEKISWMKYIFRKYDNDICCVHIKDLNYENDDDETYKMHACYFHTKYFRYKCARSISSQLQNISNKNAPIRFF